MNYKIRNLLVILIILILLIGGIVLFFISKQAPPVQIVKPPQPASQPALETARITHQVVQQNLLQKTADKTAAEISDQAAILSVSRFFIERYGSFSTAAAWQNLQDLRLVITDKLAQDFNELAESGGQVLADNNFSSITKVLSLQVAEQQLDSARVNAKTQLREMRGSEEEIYYQDVTLRLLKQGDAWLVSEVQTGEKKK